jgi:hypothetical protein
MMVMEGTKTPYHFPFGYEILQDDSKGSLIHK